MSSQDTHRFPQKKVTAFLARPHHKNTMSKRDRSTESQDHYEVTIIAPQAPIVAPQARYLLSYGFSADTWKMILVFLHTWKDLLTTRLISRDAYHWTTQFIDDQLLTDLHREYDLHYRQVFSFKDFSRNITRLPSSFQQLVNTRFSIRLESLQAKSRELEKVKLTLVVSIEKAKSAKKISRLTTELDQVVSTINDLKRELKWMMEKRTYYHYKKF